MKLSAVSADDCRRLGDALRGIARLKGSDMALPEMAAVVEGMKWLQALAVDMAKVYAEETTAKGDSAERAPVMPPPSTDGGGGLRVKDYNPGAVGGRKRR